MNGIDHRAFDLAHDRVGSSRGTRQADEDGVQDAARFSGRTILTYRSLNALGCLRSASARVWPLSTS